MLWCRLYKEFGTDSKIQMLSEAMQRRFIMLMCLHIDDEISSMTEEDIAFALRISDEELQLTKATFLRKNLLTIKQKNGIPLWSLTHWEDRQFESDDSAVRARKYRLKKKQLSNENETITSSSRDDSVTVTRLSRARAEQNRTEQNRSEQSKRARENPPPLFKNNFMIVLVDLFGEHAITHPQTAHKIATMCSVWESGGVTDEIIREGYSTALERKGHGNFGALYLQNIVLEIANPVQPKKSSGGVWRPPTEEQMAKEIAESAERLFGKGVDYGQHKRNG